MVATLQGAARAGIATAEVLPVMTRYSKLEDARPSEDG